MARKSIRGLVLERNRNCQNCGEPATHAQYRRGSSEFIEGLVLTCDSCEESDPVDGVTVDDVTEWAQLDTVFNIVDDTDLPQDEETLFKTKIQRNASICSNCFRRTHVTIDEWWPDDWRPSLIDVLRPKRYTTEDTVRAVKGGDVAARTFVGNSCKCGSISNSTIWKRPLNKDQSLECVHRIVKRLRELDIDFETDALYDAWRERKEDPDWQFSDDTIFDQAIQEAT